MESLIIKYFIIMIHDCWIPELQIQYLYIGITIIIVKRYAFTNLNNSIKRSRYRFRIYLEIRII